ncbi:DUF429 domain-containing protein [Alicyclobacillus ferrooxydans]|uniref:DUF429 domain-containing protein n=1 Tax=Alicyclobacillus ferrooxydans TaxID=471514 RepID=A0A0P9CJ30_9BACL|nr:hypothetical protein AN477_14645 [Alicyclobacillus ferrooxydans]
MTIIEGTSSGDWAGARYIGSRLCKSDEDIAQFIGPYLVPGQTVVAVDAPLVVPNQTGMRPCERYVAKAYGGRQCAAYPGHQGNMAGTRGPGLLSYLESRGVRVWAGAQMPKEHDAVHFFETYPHAAHLAMFDLPTVWKYKKKSGRSWELCRNELVEYWRRLWQLFPDVCRQILGLSDADPLAARLVPWTPAILEANVTPSVIGRGYKEFEDLTDGLFCAYIAGHIYQGKPALLFSPDSAGLPDLSRYQEGQDFILVPSV